MHKDKFCQRCLYSTSHPLGLTIDDEGICSGCRVHEEKDTLDWKNRWHELERFVEPFRSKTGKTYDCIIPVSGANDSYFIVDQVKNRLGLNPLLVTYNKYFNTKIGIKNLANLRIKFDCDLLSKNINPHSVKKITRSTLRRFGSIYWPCIAGQTVFPVQTAVSHRIPLIIWGAHQGLEQVGMFSHLHNVQMTRRYRKEHDLMGYEADDLLTIFDTLTEGDIWQYRYPLDQDIYDVGVTGIYLGNYVRWDPKSQHEKMIKTYGFTPSVLSRTFDTYDHVDCFNYMNLHDTLKLYKQGYSRVTDQAVREIRHKRLTREQGLFLVRKYEQQQTQYINQFCEWLGVSQKGFQFVLDQNRNIKYWTENSPGNWKFKGWSTGSGPNSITDSHDLNYIADKSSMNDVDSSYVTIGKGYP